MEMTYSFKEKRRRRGSLRVYNALGNVLVKIFGRFFVQFLDDPELGFLYQFGIIYLFIRYKIGLAVLQFDCFERNLVPLLDKLVDGLVGYLLRSRLYQVHALFP